MGMKASEYSRLSPVEKAVWGDVVLDLGTEVLLLSSCLCFPLLSKSSPPGLTIYQPLLQREHVKINKPQWRNITELEEGVQGKSGA